jgi:chorismate mutase / prephenate dehydratase
MARATANKKKQSAGSEHGPGRAGAAKVAEIDQQIAALIQQRAEVLKAAASPDAASACAAGFDDLAIAEIVDTAPGPLPKNALRAVFREVQSGCRALVRPLRIACLGPLYSYSHLAAMHRFGREVEFVPVGTISAVFEEVDQQHSEFGLVPVENSTDGRIADTLDMFARLPVRICGQVEMHIHHTLLAKCPRTAIQEVYSKSQPISQCRNWLAKHLPAARTIEVTSTAMAAQLAAEKPGAAAIASQPAGVEYGLDVLAENIEDNPHNATRFAVIGGQIPERTGNDRTAILFQMDHRPGTLADAMNVFKRNKLNLTWIESFPVPGSDRAYLFFAEVETHPTELRFRRAMAALQRKALRLEVLGAFPVTEPVG